MKSKMILAALNYAIEQAETSDIDVLEFLDSDHTTTVEEQIKEMIETRDLLQSKVTAKMALLMIDCCVNKNADDNAAPNSIEELAYDLMIEDGYDADYCEKIAADMFELTSDLVSSEDAQYE